MKCSILRRVRNENQSFEASALCLLLICLSLKNQPLNYVHSLPGDTGNEMDLLIGSYYYWSFVTGNAKRVEGSS